MSGEKCANTRTSWSTVNSARNNASNRTSRLNAIQNAINQANRAFNDRLDTVRNENRAREDDIRRNINGLSGNLKKAEERRLKNLQNQNRKFENRLQSQGQKVQAQIVQEQKSRRFELRQTRRQLENEIQSSVGAERIARQRELNRVNNRISNLDKNLRNEIRRVDRDLRKDMRKQRKYLENRMDNLVGEERAVREREIARLDENIGILDIAIKSVDAKLENEITRVETNFKNMLNIEAEQRKIDIKNLQDWTDANLANQRKEYIDITERQKKEIEVNRDAINKIFTKIDNNTQAATEYINNLHKIISEGYESRKLDFDKHAPGEINRILRRAKTASEQVNNQMEQAGMAEAINSYEEWITTNEKIDAKKNEFMFWHSETLKDALALFELIRKNREEGHHMIGEREIEVEGELKEIIYDAEVELDYWTNNKFSELEKEITEELKKLDKGEDINLEELKEINEKVQELRIKEAEIIEDAEVKVIASELRAEMADLVVETLEDNGFALVNSGYDRNDQRRSFIVNMKNNGGTDVVISIVPKEESNENVLIIQTKNEINYSDEQTQEIVKTITNILQEEGIQIGDIECRDKHLEEFYDFDKIYNESGGLPEKEILERGGSIN